MWPCQHLSCGRLTSWAVREQVSVAFSHTVYGHLFRQLQEMNTVLPAPPQCLVYVLQMWAPLFPHIVCHAPQHGLQKLQPLRKTAIWTALAYLFSHSPLGELLVMLQNPIRQVTSSDKPSFAYLCSHYTFCIHLPLSTQPTGSQLFIVCIMWTGTKPYSQLPTHDRAWDRGEGNSFPSPYLILIFGTKHWLQWVFRTRLSCSIAWQGDWREEKNPVGWNHCIRSSEV